MTASTTSDASRLTTYTHPHPRPHAYTHTYNAHASSAAPCFHQPRPLPSAGTAPRGKHHWGSARPSAGMQSRRYLDLICLVRWTTRAWRLSVLSLLLASFLLSLCAGGAWCVGAGAMLGDLSLNLYQAENCRHDKRLQS